MFGGGGGGRNTGGRSSPEPLYGKSDGITEIMSSTYPKSSSKKRDLSHLNNQLWLVHFDVSSSSDATLREKIVKLCQSLNAQDIKCGSVNCEDQSALCKQKGVKNYPTFKLVADKDEIAFDNSEGTVTMQALHSFVSDRIPSTVINLRTPIQVDDFIGKTLLDRKQAPKGIGLVLLTAKYDTSLLMKAASYYYAGLVPVGEVRGSNEKIIAEFGLKVDQLPAMVVVCGNAARDKMAYESIDAYDMKNLHSIKEVVTKFDKPSYCSKILSDSAKTQKVRRKAMLDHLKLSDKQLKKMKTAELMEICLLYTSPSPRDGLLSRMPSSA